MAMSSRITEVSQITVGKGGVKTGENRLNFRAGAPRFSACRSRFEAGKIFYEGFYTCEVEKSFCGQSEGFRDGFLARGNDEF